MSKQEKEQDRELRFFDIELREVGEEKPPQIEGYAAVFNSRSQMMWGFYEIIEPGFFDDVLGNDTRALFNHNRDYVLGRNSTGTLSMSQDERGLKVLITPPETDFIRDLVLEPMRRGDINQMSFAFSIKPGFVDWVEEEDGTEIRVLKKGGALQLYDVSVVTEPAYLETSADVRAKLEELQQEDKPEETDQAESGGSEVRKRRLLIAALKYSNIEQKE